MGFTQNVLNVLASDSVRWINFTFGSHMISPFLYYLLATFIRSGRVVCKTDTNLTDRALYDPNDDAILAQDHSVGARLWDEKSWLIHECTHAILDCVYAGRDMNGRASSMKVLNDETIAFLAGEIYMLAAQGPSSPAKPGPSFEARKVVKPKVKALMAKPWSGTETMVFTVQDVKDLQSAIKAHKFYTNDWNLTATHNGMRRP